MPKFRVRVVRVLRVVEDGFATVEAPDAEAAIEAAYDLDSGLPLDTDTPPIAWRRQDTDTESWEVDEDSIRPEDDPDSHPSRLVQIDGKGPILARWEADPLARQRSKETGECVTLTDPQTHLPVALIQS